MLSDVQREAVKTIEGPLLVFAGAGSGKTRVITHRIAYLIKNHFCSPEDILAVTFTNKAAREMKERISNLLRNSVNSKKIEISTFHALCLKILKKEHSLIGYPANFVIYTPYEETELVRNMMKEKNISSERYSPQGILYALSKLKNNPELKNDRRFLISNISNSMALKIMNDFKDVMKAAGAMDFDDLILNTVDIFEKNESVRRKYSEKYRYIMVDEYQDTNHMQYKLVKNLASVHSNVCVVGDDDQSIYAWRGADVSNILNFSRDFSNCKTVKLTENYRSVEEITAAAGKLIKHNKNRVDKKVNTLRKKSPESAVERFEAENEKEEAENIANKIAGLLEKGEKPSDFAVIVRTNAQTRPIEMSVSKHGIPYRIIGGNKFFENKEIKDILAYLRLLANPNDDVAFRRIVNYPSRGIGAATLQVVNRYASQKNSSLFSAVISLINSQNISSSVKNKLFTFTSLMKELKSIVSSEKPRMIARAIIEKTRIDKAVTSSAENSDVARIRNENITEFINSVSEFEERYPALSGEDFIFEYLNATSLIQDTDTPSGDEKGVSIITAHSAKGLEFDIVFIPGMYNGGFPNHMAQEEGNVSEERRLCYVAFTRARNMLFLSNPRHINKRGRRIKVDPSIFLFEAEIPSAEDAAEKMFEQAEDDVARIDLLLKKLSKSQEKN